MNENTETHGVVILEKRAHGHCVCVFASTLMTRAEAEAAVERFPGSEVVDATTLLTWKRLMMNGGRS